MNSAECKLMNELNLENFTLKQLANHFNKCAEKVENPYIQLGKLLIIARNKCKSANVTFQEWCEKNLFKKKGCPFSYKTIENYIYLAGDPDRVEKQKSMQRENIRRIRAKASGISTVDAISGLLTKQTSIKAQCDILICIWEQISEPAQEKFLQIIGAKL
jgi:hypothetical protein